LNGTIKLTYKWARRIAASVIGGSVLVVGVAMVVLPGPALIVIPLGLAILGLEFAWARRWLRAARVRAQQLMPKRQPAAGASADAQPAAPNIPERAPSDTAEHAARANRPNASL